MNSKKVALALIGIGLIAIAALAILNRGYGKVSPDAYEIATALYGACAAKSNQRLEAVEKILDGETEKQITVTEQELEWLKQIVSTARDGDWKSAASSARKMLEDQVEP